MTPAARKLWTAALRSGRQMTHAINTAILLALGVTCVVLGWVGHALHLQLLAR